MVIAGSADIKNSLVDKWFIVCFFLFYGYYEVPDFSLICLLCLIRLFQNANKDYTIGSDILTTTILSIKFTEPLPGQHCSVFICS